MPYPVPDLETTFTKDSLFILFSVQRLYSQDTVCKSSQNNSLNWRVSICYTFRFNYFSFYSILLFFCFNLLVKYLQGSKLYIKVYLEVMFSSLLSSSLSSNTSVDGLMVYFNVCWLDAPRCPFFPRTVRSFKTGSPQCRKRTLKQVHCSGSVPFGSQVDVAY